MGRAAIVNIVLLGHFATIVSFAITHENPRASISSEASPHFPSSSPLRRFKGTNIPSGRTLTSECR